MIDRFSGVPAYRQVAADLREKVESGAYAPGEKLPSESELLEAYGTSRVTVRQALALLRSEGVTETVQGKGVFVRSVPAVVRLSRSRLSKAARRANEAYFLADAAEGGFVPKVTVRVRTEDASPTHAGILGVEPGTELLVRDRVMKADEVPVQLAVSRLPRELTRGTQIEQADTGAGGVYARLEEGGIVLDHFVESVKTRTPTPEEARTLELPAGVPVLAVRRIAYDVDGRAVEVNEMVLSGDRYELVYEVPAD